MRKLIMILLALTLALGACSSARQKLSPQANVNAKTANVYYQQQNVTKAEEFYLKVLEEHPDHALSLRRMADINLYKAEQLPGRAVEFNTEAYRLYSKALDIFATFPNPSNDEILDIRDMTRRREGAWTRIYRAGEAELTAGNTQQAMEIFELAQELNPKRFEPMIRLKDIYQKELKDDQKAEEILLALLKQDPDNQKYMLEIGAFYFNTENYEEAVKYFEKVRKLSPADTDNLMNLAYAYFELEDYSKSLEVTQAALSLQPADIDVLQNAKDIAIRAGEKEMGITYLKRLIDIRPTEADYTQICMLFNEMKRFDDMINYAQKWYQWDNGSQDAVQFIILGASQTNNTALSTTFTRILQNMQRQ